MLVKFETSLECQKSNVPSLNMPAMQTEPGTVGWNPLAAAGLSSLRRPQWGSPWSPDNGERICCLFPYRVVSGGLFNLIFTSSFSFSQIF